MDGREYVKYLNFDTAKYNIPTTWSAIDKCSCLDLREDGLLVELIGDKRCDSEAAAIRSNMPIPPQMGIFYYEIEILCNGESGYFGLGICGPEVSLIRLPGWEQDSYGYHGDDGNFFQASGSGQEYGPTYREGDIVGCCVDFLNEYLFFTKNGVALDIATKLPKNIGILYPTIGMRTPGETIYVNFGQNPFRFRIDVYVFEQKKVPYMKISKQPIPCSENTTDKILVNYLRHRGYFRSAALLSEVIKIKEGDIGGEEMVETADEKLEIVRLINHGDFVSAFDAIQAAYPGLLNDNKDLHFQLASKVFIQILSGAETTAASETFAFGKRLSDMFANDPEYEEKLASLFTLLVEDPAARTKDDTLDILGDVICAISIYKGTPPLSVLETVISQLSAALRDMTEISGASPASLVNIKDIFQDNRYGF